MKDDETIAFEVIFVVHREHHTFLLFECSSDSVRNIPLPGREDTESST